MAEEQKRNFETAEEKLAYDLISGEKSREEIAKELVDRGECSQDHVWEFIHNFEQHLLGGSRFLGRNGQAFQNILNKYRNSPQGRQWLKRIYKEQIGNTLKWVVSCIVIFIVCYIAVMVIGNYAWIVILGGIGLFAAAVSIFRLFIGITRWYKVRD